MYEKIHAPQYLVGDHFISFPLSALLNWVEKPIYISKNKFIIETYCIIKCINKDIYLHKIYITRLNVISAKA